MSKFEISIEEPRKDFEKHLSLDGNNRILFSAPFGTGKTYFLKEFFKDTEKYEVVHLYPVNYSVASNEDIFELIKHDVLFELLQKDVDIDNTEFSDLFIAQNFLYENPIDIIKPFIENTSELGKSIVPIFDALKNLVKKAEVFKAEMNGNDATKAFDFLQKFSKKKGSILEKEDFYTQLIRNLVLQLNDKHKETVLIIDDLDRIDPEHIFRLLNVFAAHFDHNDSENKFAFSKIIFVTDVVNLKSIFATKYGENTDFSGYLNKFFSLNIFVFDNLKNILKKVKEFYYKTLPYDNNTNAVFNFKDANIIIGDIVINIVELLVNNGQLTTRSLIKLPERKFIFKDDSVKIIGYNKENLFKSSFIIIPVFEFISYIYGNAQLMEQAFNKLKDKVKIEYYNGISDKFIYEAIVFIIDKPNNQFAFKDDIDNIRTFAVISDFNTSIEYKFAKWGLRNNGIHSEITKMNFSHGAGVDSGYIYIFDLIYKTLKILQKDFDLFKS
jgi:Ni2+-binding GTPase involved in maturation of urease and hydrogenase